MKFIPALLALCLIGCSSNSAQTSLFDAGPQDATPETNQPDQNQEPTPITIQPPEAGSWDQPTYANDTPVNYYGGQVMTNPINVYIIWYGNWTNSSAQSLVTDLLTNIGASDYFKIDTAYYQIDNGIPPSPPLPDGGSDGGGIQFANTYHRTRQSNQVELASNDAGNSFDNFDAGTHYYVSSNIHIAATWSIGYTHGTNIANGVPTIVAETIAANKVQPDPNGVYFVFTSADVLEGGPYGGMGGFCGSYCGWHDITWVNDVSVKIAFVGDPNACLYDCTMQNTYESAGYTHSPNNDWGADGMVSVVAHELQEMATDPNPLGPAVSSTAYQDIYGQEDADKCGWTFGKLYITPNGTVANMHIGNKDYLIQQQWSITPSSSTPSGQQGCSLTP